MLEIKRIKYARQAALFLLMVACLVAGGVRAAHAEDTALVIGINNYPRLGKGADLKGCVHDAERMRDALKDLGFDVTVLTDKKAGHKDIEDSLKRVSKKLDAKSRFVCYFAGYGVTNVRAGGKKEEALLPADAREDKNDNDLPLLTLHRAVDTLPCAVKALILDTSFSGTLLREDEAKNLRPRFFLRSEQRRTRLWQQSDPTNADTEDPSILSGSTALFTAAMRTQVAYERSGGGGDDGGVFTNALLSELKGKPTRWQEVQSRVTAAVATATGSQQTPLLLPVSFLYRGVLSDAPTPRAPSDVSLRDLYNMSRPSASVVTLRIDPNKTRLLVMEPVRFKVNVGADGYLLLIGRDPKNRVALVWPVNDTIQSAQVKKGSVYVPGQEKAAFLADTPGDDHLKAFWFPLSARDSVANLLKLLRSGVSGDAVQSLQQTKLSSVLFATSELHTRIEITPAKP